MLVRSLSTSICALAILCAHAQVSKPKTAEDRITLAPTSGGKVNYRLDKGSPHELPKELEITVANDAFSIYCEFANPLQLQVSSEAEVLDDELYKAAASYLDGVTAFFQTVGAAQIVGNGRPMPIGTFTTLDPQIAELYYFLIAATGANLAATLNGSSQAEKAMGDLKLEVTKDSIRVNVDKLFNGLATITTHADITKVIASNDAVIIRLNNHVRDVRTRFTLMQGLLAGHFTTPALLVQQIAAERVAAIGREIDGVETHLKDQMVRYGKLKELFVEIGKRTTDGTSMMIYDIPEVTSAKNTKVQIHVQEVKYDGATRSITLGDKKTYSLLVSRFRRILPIISTGLFYTSLSYGSFGTDTDDNGNTVVSAINGKTDQFASAAHLNLTLNTNSEALPFIQLGAGFSSERPILFGGLGMSLMERVSISFGAAFTWQQALQNLALGDVVEGTAEIEEDVKYDFDTNAAFYVGIGVNITK